MKEPRRTSAIKTGRGFPSPMHRNLTCEFVKRGCFFCHDLLYFAPGDFVRGRLCAVPRVLIVP
jgi:hypothetical protein